ncbi:hypothetical protein [Xanthobacter flavus]|uniref:hypothetical protein n=1 Tax=Xanthobacter flavus TaxID=281 RepID=UPI0037295BD8
MSKESTADDSSGSSPAGRGGAGVYIEGELGAFYLLAMLADSEPRGLPGSRLDRVSFQGAERGFALDDLIIGDASAAGRATLEIQSKRTIKFSSKDPIFKEVCEQIAATVVGKPERSHHVAVATQRTSHAISGPYQDVLEWARKADDGASFFARLDAKGVAGDAMRAFGKTFRDNLVSAGVPDEDEATWRIIRRFQILEFDFESSAPMARTLAVILARLALSPDDADRVEALRTSLIAISIETAKAGGSLECEGLQQRAAAGLSPHSAFVANLRRTAGVTAMLPEFSSMAGGPYEVAVVEGKVVGAELADEKELPALAGGEDEANPVLRQSRGEGARTGDLGLINGKRRRGRRLLNRRCLVRLNHRSHPLRRGDALFPEGRGVKPFFLQLRPNQCAEAHRFGEAAEAPRQAAR